MIWLTGLGSVLITAVAVSALRSDPYRKRKGDGGDGGGWFDAGADGGDCGGDGGGGCD